MSILGSRRILAMGDDRGWGKIGRHAPQIPQFHKGMERNCRVWISSGATHSGITHCKDLLKKAIIPSVTLEKGKEPPIQEDILFVSGHCYFPTQQADEHKWTPHPVYQLFRYIYTCYYFGVQEIHCTVYNVFVYLCTLWEIDFKIHPLALFRWFQTCKIEICLTF